MKILHIITSLNSGGAESVLFKIVTNDSENEHHVISLRFHDFYFNKFKKANINVDVVFKSTFFSFKGILKLYNLIKNSKPDLIQTWMFHSNLLGGLIGRIAGVKKIFWSIRGPYNKSLYGLSTKLVIYLSYLLTNIIPVKVIYNSYYSMNSFDFFSQNSKKNIVIHNGFKIEDNNYNSTSKDIFYLGMAARYDAFKDHDTLINALEICNKKISNFHCLLAGKEINYQNNKLVKYINMKVLNDRITLLDEQSYIDDFMKKLDVFVLSSIDESFPNVVGEAMANKVPCIATDVGDTSILIGDTGWTVKKSDPIELSNAIIDSYTIWNSHKDIWLDKKNACFDRVSSQFSFEKMLNNFKEVWSLA